MPASAPVTSLEVRRHLIDLLRSDVLGPIGKDHSGNPDPNEKLEMEDGVPQNFYITGYLEPRRWDSQEENIEGLHDDTRIPENPDDPGQEANSKEITGEEESQFSEEVGSGTTLQAPSSMGISVVLPMNAPTLEVTASWGTYSKEEGTDMWLREPHTISQDFSESEINEIDGGSRQFETDQEGVWIHLRVQTIGSRRHVTCRLVNKKELSDDADQQERGESTIFQCQIKLESPEFLDARWQSDLETDPTTAILYHDSKVYSRGHNISVDWSEDGTAVWSEWIPSFDIKRMKENTELRDHIPPMEDLIDPSRYKTGLASLYGLIEEYERWADDVEAWYGNGGDKKIAETLHSKFHDHVSSMRSTVDRMRKGLDLVAEPGAAARAFQKANDSIYRASAEAPAGGIPEFRWRPFQISFILLNLAGLLWDEKSSEKDDRSIVDLAWFPTGGGKTEAYLGLIAALGFYRLEKGVDQVPSVHSIMRYTLRLLTLNQGERAARLMAAMNAVARDGGISGDPFRVGMWIGSAATPNDLAEARQILNEMARTGAQPKRATPIQLEDCPWCGHDVSNPDFWRIEDGRFLGFCPQKTCELHARPIPFSCIDQEIYDHPPTLLIGTVDKFARLGSVSQSRVLLGLKSGDIHRRPPDLVVQDELHLLTGPLGSLSGLFESAIETLWARAGHTAKYVAATATIRGAERDSQLMYGRDLNVFPPPGNTIRDNFFASEDLDSHGRIHLGIIGNIGHSTTLLERPLASLLQRTQDLRLSASDENIVDPYWTPIGYFNSLRELSGAQSSIEDSISQQWIPEFSQRSGTNEREITSVRELYSRKRSHELKQTMARLKRSISDGDCLDICLTTNMFQVGIDVDRLGLMLINGQPKSNSEYIQASGRVGRSGTPGLVISLLRSTKPRDLSHYEMHRSFHQEMYRHVDITTTTPFSARSFDRASASVIMLLLRQGIEGMAENEGVRKLSFPDSQRRAEIIVQKFLDSVLERVIDPSQKNEVTQRFRGQWMQLKEWSQRHAKDGLWRSSDPFKPAWAKQFHSGPDLAHDILDSMRDVTDDIPFGTHSTSYGNWIKGKVSEAHLFTHALPGGLWDYEGNAYMTDGLNNWSMSPQQRLQNEINEDVLTTLLGGVKLFSPPRSKTQGMVTVKDMPYHVRCLAEPGHISSGKRSKDGTKCDHQGCDKEAVPVRFISLCSDGHLSPFSWNSWVRHLDKCSYKHNSATDNIRIFKRKGAGYTLRAWVVKCEACGQSRSLKGVTVSKTGSGPKCYGLSPWLDWTPSNNCDKRLSTRRRNSSSVGLADGGKVLLIHPKVNWYLAGRIPQLMNLPDNKLDARFDLYFEDICEDGTLDGTIYDRRVFDPKADPKFDRDGFYRELVNYRDRPDSARRENVRQIEREGLAHGQRQKVDDGHHYLCYTEFGGEVTRDGWWQEPGCPLDHLSRVERLTEVQYITGVQRMEGTKSQPIAQFSGDDGDWKLGTYNYGEGIYIGIKPEWLSDQVASMGAGRAAFSAESISRRAIAKEIDFENPHVIAALPVVHTLSHLLIKELCVESGYSLGSIGERLYLQGDDDGVKYAGILLYTTGSSSDGTMGGLASQARPDQIEKIVKLAIRRKGECSNDPICSDHAPTPEEPNGSACHACVLLPETCCELGNSALDREWEG